MSDLHAAVGAPPTASVTSQRFCRCVVKHVPDVRVVHSHHIWPQGEGGPDVTANRVWLCPTAHYNVHFILDFMLKNKGVRPRGRGNTYHVSLAERGYRCIQAKAMVR